MVDLSGVFQYELRRRLVAIGAIHHMAETSTGLRSASPAVVSMHRYFFLSLGDPWLPSY